MHDELCNRVVNGGVRIMRINSTIRQTGRAAAAAGGPRPRPSQGLSYKGERARTTEDRRALARRFALCTGLNSPTALQEPSGKNGDVKVIYHRLEKDLFLGEVGVARFCYLLDV